MHELVVLVGSTRLMLGLGFAYVVLVVMCVREETEMNKVLYTTIIAHAPETGERDVRFLLLLSRPCSHYHIFYFVRADICAHFLWCSRHDLCMRSRLRGV